METDSDVGNKLAVTSWEREGEGLDRNKGFKPQTTMWKINKLCVVMNFICMF